MCWALLVLGVQLGEKLMKLTLFIGEGAVDINILFTKINVIINCEKVKEEKYSDVKACVRRIWPGWENPELQEK